MLKKVSRLPEIFLGQILLRELSKCNLETSLTRIWHKKISGSRLIFFNTAPQLLFFLKEVDMARYEVQKGPMCHMCVPVTLCLFLRFFKIYSDHLYVFSVL